MEPNHIHIFLEKILATASCPRCGDKIKLQNILVQASTERTCIFKIHCDKCQSSSLAQAVINVEPVNNINNHSYPIVNTPPKISEEEIKEAEESLKISGHKKLADFFYKR